jgi:hypothetical protein
MTGKALKAEIFYHRAEGFFQGAWNFGNLTGLETQENEEEVLPFEEYEE